MPFAQIQFYQFRNLKNSRIPVPSEQVFFIGENGQGKTNFLEAVYFLCYGRSFRTKRDDQLVRHGADEAMVLGRWNDGGPDTEIKITMNKGKKEIRLDGRLLEDRGELVDLVPCVVFSHEDIDFVKGSPDMQRWFFNQTCSMIDREYLEHLRRYTKLLKSRNLVLKDGRRDLLGPYDHQLALHGIELQAFRKRAMVLVNEVVGRIFARVSGLQGDFSIDYQPNWGEPEGELEAIRILEERRELDLAQRTTTRGPHRDRFAFRYEGKDFTQMGSTGQLRLISLILRAAQAEILHDYRGRRPVLLIDDVLLELDDEKRKRFLSCLPAFSQAFYTFLPDEHVREYIQGERISFLVQDGEFHEKRFGTAE